MDRYINGNIETTRDDLTLLESIARDFVVQIDPFPSRAVCDCLLSHLTQNIHYDLFILRSVLILGCSHVNLYRNLDSEDWIAKLAIILCHENTTKFHINLVSDVLGRIIATSELSRDEIRQFSTILPILLGALDESPECSPILEVLVLICKQCQLKEHAVTSSSPESPFLQALDSPNINASVGHTLISRLNTPSSVQDHANALSIMKFCLEIRSSLFYLNDLRVLVDICIREIQRTGDEDSKGLMKDYAEIIRMTCPLVDGLSEYHQAELHSFVKRLHQSDDSVVWESVISILLPQKPCQQQENFYVQDDI